MEWYIAHSMEFVQLLPITVYFYNTSVDINQITQIYIYTTEFIVVIFFKM